MNYFNNRKLLPTVFIIILLIAVLKSSAQKESSAWYFGRYAGLDFSAGLPEPLTNGEINTFEGCTSWSDSLGNLCFYSDGVTVWNSEHQIMDNGTGLMGDSSTAQTILAVPQPGNTNQIFLFTVDDLQLVDNETVTDGLRLSKVDMTLNNGLGAVTEKNLLLFDSVSEKITAVKKANESAYWVIAHEWGNNRFRAYEIDTDGFHDTPVLSDVGTPHTQIMPNIIINSIGTMKLNPQGNKLALAMLRSSLAELFDFDPVTGIVSNPVTINFGGYGVYGTEFSPDGSKLYISADTKLYSVDVNAGTPSDIINSLTLIAEEEHYTGTMQTATDGKIYCSVDDAQYLGIIRAPNKAAANCDYISDGIFLNGGQARKGLPNFISSLFLPPDFYAVPDCYGTETQFYLADTTGVDSVFWDFGDIDSGILNYSQLVEPTHIYTDTGDFQIQVSLWNSGIETVISDWITVSYAETVDLGVDTVLCDEPEYIMDAQGENLSYLWQDGTTDAIYHATESGDYRLTVTNDYTGCKHSDTVQVILSAAPGLQLGADTVFCEQSNFFIEPVTDCDTCSFEWSDGAGENVLYPEASGYYALTLTNGDGCIAFDTVTLTMLTIPIVDLGMDTTVCEDTPYLLTAEFPDSEYLWSDESTDAQLSVYSSGTYSVEITNVCGTFTDSVSVDFEYCGDIYIPNIITPNNDGINDFFSIKGIENGPWQLSIFSRWGNRVYYSENYCNDWSAEGRDEGVYFYILLSKDDPQKFEGFIHVRREH
ncbi:MAG: gliding motility-associated C-terminal domain-containing protein [Bacteroidota bacterium]|nr:gliding motility-associated C-terminal domain-containing protein [Bacteroidota bacterium]